MFLILVRLGLNRKHPSSLSTFYFVTHAPNTTLYRFTSPHSKKLSSSWAMLDVWCLIVNPCLDNTYKYSPIEYARTFNLSFLVAEFFSQMRRFILESFLSNFLSSDVQPELAIRSRCTLLSLCTPLQSFLSFNS